MIGAIIVLSIVAFVAVCAGILFFALMRSAQREISFYRKQQNILEGVCEGLQDIVSAINQK